MKAVTEIARELADREAIRDCLFRYCRGIDRMDESLLQDVYWPGAMDEHAGFVGTGEEFIAHAMQALAPLEQTMHALGNILIEISGDTAWVESYFQAFHRIPGEKEPWDLIVGGRYVDRMEKRDDVWRIGHRVVMIDWLRSFADSADWTDLPLGMSVKPGVHGPGDRSYDLRRETLGR
jgi:hypothetical protein